VRWYCSSVDRISWMLPWLTWSISLALGCLGVGMGACVRVFGFRVVRGKSDQGLGAVEHVRALAALRKSWTCMFDTCSNPSTTAEDDLVYCQRLCRCRRTSDKKHGCFGIGNIGRPAAMSCAKAAEEQQIRSAAHTNQHSAEAECLSSSAPRYCHMKSSARQPSRGASRAVARFPRGGD
jgi:hypothetical protein